MNKEDWTLHRRTLQRRVEYWTEKLSQFPNDRRTKSIQIDYHRMIDNWDNNVHREAKMNGFSRGILGGFNHDCVCGSHWVSDDGTKTTCPEQR